MESLLLLRIDEFMKRKGMETEEWTAREAGYLLYYSTLNCPGVMAAVRGVNLDDLNIFFASPSISLEVFTYHMLDSYISIDCPIYQTASLYYIPISIRENTTSSNSIRSSPLLIPHIPQSWKQFVKYHSKTSHQFSCQLPKPSLHYS